MVSPSVVTRVRGALIICKVYFYYTSYLADPAHHDIYRCLIDAQRTADISKTNGGEAIWDSARR